MQPGSYGINGGMSKAQVCTRCRSVLECNLEPHGNNGRHGCEARNYLLVAIVCVLMLMAPRTTFFVSAVPHNNAAKLTLKSPPTNQLTSRPTRAAPDPEKEVLDGGWYRRLLDQDLGDKVIDTASGGGDSAPSHQHVQQRRTQEGVARSISSGSSGGEGVGGEANGPATGGIPAAGVLGATAGGAADSGGASRLQLKDSGDGGDGDTAGGGNNDDDDDGDGNNDNDDGDGNNDNDDGDGNNDNDDGDGNNDDTAGDSGKDDTVGSGGNDDTAGGGNNDDTAGDGGNDDTTGDGLAEDDIIRPAPSVSASPPPIAPVAAVSRPHTATGPARSPPLELEIIPNQPVEIPDKCVFILGTGRSGSTSLMDALNQLPKYLIRGEQEGAFWFLYLAWRMLNNAKQHSSSFLTHQRQAERRFGTREAGWLSLDTVKRVYVTYAVQRKLPWFNDLHDARINDGLRAVYASTYGYHGPGVVSGFKEIRFVCGRAFPSSDCQYKHFNDFIRFLRMLCHDVKVLLNSRSSSALTDNAKLTSMLTHGGVINDTRQFDKDLATTHSWYDRYAKEHHGSAFRVLMEDMFDEKRNVTLARRLLKFLGEDEHANISFVRMPTWSKGGKIWRDRPKTEEQDPWAIRRQGRLR